jgi:hypothetical protein
MGLRMETTFGLISAIIRFPISKLLSGLSHLKTPKDRHMAATLTFPLRLRHGFVADEARVHLAANEAGLQGALVYLSYRMT